MVGEDEPMARWLLSPVVTKRSAELRRCEERHVLARWGCNPAPPGVSWTGGRLRLEAGQTDSSIPAARTLPRAVNDTPAIKLELRQR